MGKALLGYYRTGFTTYEYQVPVIAPVTVLIQMIDSFQIIIISNTIKDFIL